MDNNQAKPEELQERISALSRMLIKSFSYVEADPDTFLLNARKTAETICKFIYNKEIGDDPSKKLMLNDLGKALVNQKIIPERIGILIGTIQTYGNYGAHAQDDFSETSREWISPCQTALANLSNWFFLDYLKGQIPTELAIPLKEFTDSEVINEIPAKSISKKRIISVSLLVVAFLVVLAVFYFTRNEKTEKPINLANDKTEESAVVPVSIQNLPDDVVKSPNAMRMAVLYFDCSNNDQKFSGLSKGLADMLITDLSKFYMLQVVERSKLEEILKEQNLSNSKRFDENTAVKIGKLLGAQSIMVGSYFELLGSFRMDARIIDVETGKIIRSEGVTGAIDKFFDLEKELVGRIISGLAITLKEGEDQFLKTKSAKKMTVTAGIEYSQALDMIDKGDTKKGEEQLELVLKENPDFEPARKVLQYINK